MPIQAETTPATVARRLRLGLAPKLLGTVGLLALLAAGVAGLGYAGLGEAEQRFAVQASVTDRALTAGHAEAELVNLARAVEWLPIDLPPAERQAWEAAAAADLRQLESRFVKLEAALVVPENRRRLQEAKALLERYRPVHAQVVELSRAGKLDEAGKVALTGAAEINEVRDRLRAIADGTAGLVANGVVRSGEEAARSRTWLLVTSATGCLGVLALALLVVLRGVTGPLRRLAAAAGRLSAGKLEEETTGRDRGDEIGALAQGLEDLRLAARRARALEAEAAEARGAAEQQRVRAQHGMAESLERSMGGVTRALATSAGELQATIQTLSANAGRTAELAGTVAAGAAQASGNVQTVSAAAEELAASVSEISRQVAQAAQVAGRAVAEARSTDAVVNGLAEGASRIGEVVRLISDIAGQTNLLALNATIEAARAGEAGKGFAVVASEVKQLAAQTAKATEEIGSQIGAIQGATAQAVQSIRGIAGVVSEIDHIAGSIAAAVEQQGAATREIARNVAEAAEGTNHVSATIAEVTGGVEETGGAIAALRQASDEIARQGEAVRGELGALVAGLRGAA